MPSGVQKKAGNRFDCKYEHPWGGVAIDADPADINANEFPIATGIFIKNGRLNAAGWGNTSAFNYSDTTNQHYFSTAAISFLTVITDLNNNPSLYAFGFNSGNITVWQYSFTTNGFSVVATLAGSGTLDCYQTIAGVVYIFDYFNGRMLVFNSRTNSLTVGQTFVGGKYCCVISGYLLTANSNQPTDSPAQKTNRYNWSSPFGYTTWDPGVDRTAGFNTITSTSDQITGMFSMGNVGYVLRNQGLTQLTPAGIGIQPFDTTDLWNSQFGIGCTYPTSFAQYGNLAVWANDNNIYAFVSGAIPQAITGSAKAAIYADLNLYENRGEILTFVGGSFSNTSEYSTVPELTYTLVIINYNNVVGNNDIISTNIWTYNLNNKTWTKQVPDFNAQIRALVSVPTHYGINSITVQGTSQFDWRNISAPFLSVNKRIRNNIIINTSVGSFLFSFYYSENGQASNCPTVLPINLQFKQEEFELLTQPTVRGVGLKLAGIGTLNVNVIGQDASNNPVNYQFGPLTLSAVNRFVVQQKLTAVCSLQNPQLIITSTNFDGSIVKAKMMTTFDEGEQV